MSRHPFHRLRRCRAVFALALCAWLLMASVAWAKADCCASPSMPGMTSMHADGHAPHPALHHAEGCQCACTQASADGSGTALLKPGSIAPGKACWPVAAQAAPQPRYAPLLRPPVV